METTTLSSRGSKTLRCNMNQSLRNAKRVCTGDGHGVIAVDTRVDRLQEHFAACSNIVEECSWSDRHVPLAVDTCRCTVIFSLVRSNRLQEITQHSVSIALCVKTDQRQAPSENELHSVYTALCVDISMKDRTSRRCHEDHARSSRLAWLYCK